MCISTKMDSWVGSLPYVHLMYVVEITCVPHGWVRNRLAIRKVLCFVKECASSVG